MTIGTVTSIGYQKRSLDELLDLLEQADVDVVVDVRETPWSYRREFAKGNLTDQLHSRSIDYLHAKFAGNPKEIRRNAVNHSACLTTYEQYLEANDQIVLSFEETVGTMLREGKNVCLICYERHPEDCHRNIVLRSWMKHTALNPDVVHLGPDGCSRLT